MASDPLDILLTGDAAVQDFQELAKSRLTTPKLRVMVLLAAAAYEAEDGNVAPQYVERAFKAARRMAKGRGAKPN